VENSSSKDILKKIKSANKILIPLHQGPDGDTLGCSMAVKYWLERDFNKKIKVISPDQLGGELTSFDFIKEIEFGKGIRDLDLKEFDLILFLNCLKI